METLSWNGSSVTVEELEQMAADMDQRAARSRRTGYGNPADYEDEATAIRRFIALGEQNTAK